MPWITRLLLWGPTWRVKSSGCFGGKVRMDWENTYQSCCWRCDADCFPDISAEDARNVLRARCAKCCCEEVNYTSIQRSMITYVPTLMYTDVGRVANAMPEVYVASYYMWTQCFRNAPGSGGWLSAPSPLGVLALRLFFLIGEVEEARDVTSSLHVDLMQGFQSSLQHVPEGANDSLATNVPPIKQTLSHLTVAFQDPNVSGELCAGRWPIFLLVWALLRRLPDTFIDPASHLIERARLRQDEGPDGHFFRALWGYMNVTVCSDQPFVTAEFVTQLALAASRGLSVTGGVAGRAILSTSLRPIARLALLVLAQEQESVPNIDAVYFDEGVAETARAVILTATNLHQLLFHAFPVVPLLDRISVPPSVMVERDVKVYLPRVRAMAVDVDAFQAAKIRAQASACCASEFDEILAAGHVSLVVDVGAQFGACTAVAARNFPELQFVAIEMVEANAALLQKTVRFNRLSANLKVRAARLTAGCEDDISCTSAYNARGAPIRSYACDCSTLDLEFARLARQSERGILLWLGQLQPNLDRVLAGGRKLFASRAVTIVGVVTTTPYLEVVRRYLAASYRLVERPGSYDAIFILAIHRELNRA